MKKIISKFIAEVNAKNQNDPEFMQAVTEVAETVIPYIVKHDIYYGQNILLRMAEPERVLSFRVAWIDDNEEIQVNRGYRVQMVYGGSKKSCSSCCPKECQEPALPAPGARVG